MFAKVKGLLKSQLTQGSSPEKLAQSVSFGMVIGCFPVLGLATPLAVLVTHFSKLNHVVVQAVSYSMYPVQIPLIPVYLKAVSFFTDVGFVPLRPDALYTEYSLDPSAFLRKYSLVALYAILMWLGLSLVLFPILCRVFLPVVLRLRFAKTPPDSN